MKGKIFQIVLILLLVVASFTGCAKSQSQEVPQPAPPPALPIEPQPEPQPEPSLPPEFFLDSDGDGFNDWFETNIAGYDPNVPNDRYIIIFDWVEDFPDPKQRLSSVKARYEFWTEIEGIPPENVVLLTTAETATSSGLEDAIKRIAEKSDENDIVFLRISTHAWIIQGFTPSHRLADGYALIDSWLDEINAMVVIVSTTSCDAEVSLSVWNDGPCPRIVFLWYGELMSALGYGPIGLESNIEVDTIYGNGDGYVSLEEIHNWYENDWKFQSPMAEESGRGIPTMLDESDVASKIYLTDYTTYDLPPALRNY